MADSVALENDVLRAVTLEADGSMEDLLRGRLALDRVVVIQGKNDVRRASPGELFGKVIEAAQLADDAGQAGPGRSLDEYLADAKEWKQRLRQLREWLDKLSADDDGEGGSGAETLEERLAREIAEKGYANVIAENLRREAPAFVVHEIIADGLSSSRLPGDLLDIRVTNLSTAPELSAEPLRLTMRSRSGALQVEIALGGRSAAPDDNVVRFSLSGLPVESIAGSLARGGKSPLSGGTLDISLDGTWASEGVGFLDLPLSVTLRGVTVALPGGARTVDGVTLLFQISGPIDDPTITFDDGALTDALLAGARAQIEGEFERRKDELQSEIDSREAELQAEIDARKAEAQAKLDAKLGGFLGDVDGQPADADPLDQAKKKAEKELKSKAKGVLGGLFGGKKKKDDDDGDD